MREGLKELNHNLTDIWTCWSPTSCPPGQTIPIKLIPLKKWSPTNSVSMDKWSPKIWSPWTNGPQSIRSSYFGIPTACPPGHMEYFRDSLSRRKKLVGDHLSIRTMGVNWLGTVCPGGPINWGPIVGD